MNVYSPVLREANMATRDLKLIPVLFSLDRFGAFVHEFLTSPCWKSFPVEDY